MGYRSPEPIASAHEIETFDCGQPALDEWLKRHARASHASGGARVFVTTLTEAPTRVIGYYALAAAEIEPAGATERLLKGQPRQRPVPVVLLARLAVGREHQRRRVGGSLLRDAMLRVLHASDAIGIRALVVHATDRRARAWYEQFGFEPAPTDPLHLILLLKDLRHFFASGNE
ncbi:MAG: GNAT family N-acetyltransferase [Solirubrobacteraceae bacterium]